MVRVLAVTSLTTDVHSAVVAEWESQSHVRHVDCPYHQGVHSAVVAEWESQYLGPLRSATNGGVHSAVVAEWESQSLAGRGPGTPGWCTPLSWRSGSLNEMPVLARSIGHVCTPLSWRSGSLNSADSRSAAPGRGVHSAVVAEWESQYGGGDCRDQTRRVVHSAVVAEWESQYDPGVELDTQLLCTPLSWRSGSLNNHSAFAAFVACTACTPLSWRSGSLNPTTGHVQMYIGNGVHSAVVAEWESQYLGPLRSATNGGRALRCRGGVGVSTRRRRARWRCCPTRALRCRGGVGVSTVCG